MAFRWVFTGVMDKDLPALAAAARDGDGGALESLLSAVEPLLRRRARRLVDAATADDVVQDSLVEVHQSISSLREPAAVVSWLGLVARKHADRHRRRARSTVLLDLAVDVVPAADDGPEDAAVRSDDAAAVRRALALASDQDRLILTLRYFADWSDTDLGSLLGISRGAARKRLHDARQRLRPLLAGRKPAFHELSTEESMTTVNSLIGRRWEIGTAPDLPRPPALRRPDPPTALATGLKAIDAIAPWPAGGTVDLLGPVGTGHLVLLGEAAHNMDAVIVAVHAARSSADGSSARLAKLLDADAKGVPVIVVDATGALVAAAVEYGRRAALRLAAGRRTVLLAVDRVVADEIGEDGLRAIAGAGPGPVTAIRVAPHARDAAPTPAWVGADATTVLSLAESLAGRFPAVDVPACRSVVLDHLDEKTRHAASECQRLLATARRARDYLAQPFWMAEAITGEPGKAVSANDATAGLIQALRADGA